MAQQAHAFLPCMGQGKWQGAQHTLHVRHVWSLSPARHLYAPISVQPCCVAYCGCSSHAGHGGSSDRNRHACMHAMAELGPKPMARFALCGCKNHRGSRSSGSHAVHNRLYSYAQDKAERLEHRRKLAEVEETAELLQKRASMSWISSEMMKGRGSGLYENYGEMLYAEGVESWMIKEKKVRGYDCT